MNPLNSRLSCGMNRLALAIAAALISLDATAENTMLDVINVDAQTEPAASEVDRATTQALRPATSDAASLLRQVPGVSLNGAGGVSSLPSIRGLADDRLRIKLDGMDLIATCPNHMNPPLSYVDPSQIAGLTVFAGITPVSVGGDSIGGTIIAETRAPEFAAPGEGSLTKGEVGSFYRSNNDARGANLTATYANEAFNISYSGAWSKADNYTAADDFKDYTATGRVGHTLSEDEVGSTAFETQNHDLGLAFKTGTGLFELGFGYQDMPEQLYPNQRMDLLDNTQKRVNVRHLGGFDWGDLELSAYHESVDHFMDFGPDKRFWYGKNSQPPKADEVGTPCDPIRFHGDPLGSCAAGMPMVSESETVGARVQGDIEIADDAVLRLGAEYQRYRLDDYWTASGGGMGPDTFLNINDGERDRMAVFAEWESQQGPQWLTQFGLRYERVRTDAGEVQGYRTTPGAPGNQIADAEAFNAQDRDKSDDNVDLTVLARYRHDANLDLEFGFARKVRSPNLYERYTWSTWPMAAAMNNFVGDGNGYVGDVDLQPEKAHTVSATIDWHAEDRGWQFKATPFYTRVSDYIDAVATEVWMEDQFNVLQYKNQSARLYGIDISGHMPLAKTGWGALGLEGLVNFTDGENRDTDDELYNVMPLNTRLTLTHRLGPWDNALELVWVDDKERVSDVRNEIQTDSYTLANLRTSYSWKQLRLDFGIENLFDEFYYQPTGGAYLGQGSTMQLNGVSWDTAVPGMGRSFYTGLTLTF